MTAMAGEAPRWRQARAMTATTTATVGEAPRWRRTSTATTTETAMVGGRGAGGRAIAAVAVAATVVATTVSTTMAAATTTTAGVVHAWVGQKLLILTFYEFFLIGHKHGTFHLTQCMMKINYYNIYLTAYHPHKCSITSAKSFLSV